MTSDVEVNPKGRVRTETGSSKKTEQRHPAAPKIQVWTGWVLTILFALFMVVDNVIKLIPIAAVSDALGPLGFPTDATFERGLGVLGLFCTILYIIPRTSILGAILLTGYLGGAIAAQLRVGNPLFSHLLFGAYLGIIAWGGLWLRMPAVRAIIPINGVSYRRRGRSSISDA
jgi:hypothetical protein